MIIMNTLGPTDNVPVRCNGCNCLFYAEPPKASDPCWLCKSKNTEKISEEEATNLFKESLRKSIAADVKDISDKEAARKFCI